MDRGFPVSRFAVMIGGGRPKSWQLAPDSDNESTFM